MDEPRFNLDLRQREKEELSRHNSVSRASSWSQTVRQQWHDRSQFQAFSQVHGREWLGCHAGHQEVSRCHTEVNLREWVTCMLLPSANEGAHSGFETQRRCHQKSKTGVSVTPQKVLQKFFKRRKKEFVCTLKSYFNRLMWRFVNDTEEINLQFLFSNPSSSIVCRRGSRK